MLEELSGLKRTNNINQDRYDFNLFDELSENSNTLKDVLSTPPIANEPWKAIAQDMWAGFYKMSPELTEIEKVDLKYQANRSFVEKFLEDPLTEQIRSYTVLDELASGIAAIGSIQQLNKEFQQRPELQKKLNEVFNNEEETVDIQKVLEEINGISRDIRRSMNEAIKAGQKEIDEVYSCMRGWGVEPAEMKHIPMKKRIELVNFIKNNRRLKNLAQIIGKFRNLARSVQKEKISSHQDEIHDITLGNDLAYILPVELAQISHPVLKKDFYRKYSEQSLIQYELQAKEKKGQGPMVILIDTSGSMSGAPLDLSIATALALIDTAFRQKRYAYVVFFADTILGEFEFNPKEKDNMEKFINIAQVGASGGTDFEAPLKKGLEVIQKSEYQKADMIFITDGCCDVEKDFQDQFLKLKETLLFNLYSVLIGVESKVITTLSNRIWQVNNINEDTASEIFEIVV